MTSPQTINLDPDVCRQLAGVLQTKANEVREFAGRVGQTLPMAIESGSVDGQPMPAVEAAAVKFDPTVKKATTGLNQIGDNLDQLASLLAGQANATQDVDESTAAAQEATDV